VLYLKLQSFHDISQRTPYVLQRTVHTAREILCLQETFMQYENIVIRSVLFSACGRTQKSGVVLSPTTRHSTITHSLRRNQNDGILALLRGHIESKPCQMLATVHSSLTMHNEPVSSCFNTGDEQKSPPPWPNSARREELDNILFLMQVYHESRML
jgi:hypothetical protein